VGVVERRTAKILVDSEAKWQIHVQPKAMLVWIDLYHPELQLQMKDSKVGLAADRLSDDRRSGRINANDAQVEYTSPSGGVGEKRPDNIDRCDNDSRWAAR
jgi:hypothetical protein